MRYWVYIKDKVEGPYEEDKLVTLQGFTPDTLICSEEVAAGGSQEWVKASSIFEFDEIEKTVNQPLPDFSSAAQAEPVQAEPIATAAVATAGAVSASDDLARLLLEKLDMLTQKIEGMEGKLSGMQSQLESIETAQRNAPQMAAPIGTHPEYIAPDLNSDGPATITLTRHDVISEVENDDAAITNTASLVSQAEDMVSEANKEEKPLDMLGEMNLDDNAQNTVSTEVDLGSKAEEEVILTAALDSLYNAKIQSQEEKESTFQDLLTPQQAAALAAQAPKEEPKQSLEEALSEAPEPVQMPAPIETTPTEEEAAKDALLNELTASPKEDVLDQVIREREEEKQQTDGLKMAAAGAAIGAAALAGMAAFGKEEEEKTEEQPQLAEMPLPVQNEEAPLPVADTQEEPVPFQAPTLEEAPAPIEEAPAPVEPINFENVQEAPSLTIAADKNEPEKQEEVLPADQMPADEPSQPAAPAVPATDIPSVEDAGKKVEQQQEEENKEATLQELVPGATMEKPEGVLITEQDLQDAFTERDSKEDASVEQLFGVASAEGAAAVAAEADQPAEAEEPQVIPQFPDQQPEPEPAPFQQQDNSNDLTEIELKEGSTYLISDFVPPAQTDSNALPKELTQKLDASAAQGAVQQEGNTTFIEEMVPATATATAATAAAVAAVATKNEDEEKTEKAGDDLEAMASATTTLNFSEKPLENADSVPQDVTVSQIILENTIRTKRGASLDIKTVPMVPEPEHGERLHLEGLDDDINTQHDIKSADIKPAGKSFKMVLGSLVVLLLAAVIYVMLAFMNLIPAQFNFISGDKAAVQQTQQQEQMNEILGEETVVDNQNAALPAAPAADPMAVVLEDVKNYPLANGYSLQDFIDTKHAALQSFITWDVTTAVEPDNYAVLVKVPPENPQSFKLTYRFNYNAITRELKPVTSDAKNLLDSVNQQAGIQQPEGLPQNVAPQAVQY